MLIVRPKVAELVFRLFGRPLHPELFEVCASQTVERDEYQAKIDITSTGHVIAWRRGGLTLTEVTTSAHHPLPERRRLMSYRLKGHRSDQIECRGGIRYQVSFQLEPVPPEVFWTFQEELCREGPRLGLLQHFDASGRIALGAISFIHVESRIRTLTLRTFHTFPDDYAIVKTQSVFEIPRGLHH
ncbi:MAG: DUF2617 family protein [Thermoguttaceae bacterium]